MLRIAAGHSRERRRVPLSDDRVAKLLHCAKQSLNTHHGSAAPAMPKWQEIQTSKAKLARKREAQWLEQQKTATYKEKVQKGGVGKGGGGEEGGASLPMITSGPFAHRAAHWGFRLLRLPRRELAVGDILDIDVRVALGSSWEDLDGWRWRVTRRGDPPDDDDGYDDDGEDEEHGEGEDEDEDEEIEVEFMSLSDLARLREASGAASSVGPAREEGRKEGKGEVEERVPSTTTATKRRR